MIKFRSKMIMLEFKMVKFLSKKDELGPKWVPLGSKMAKLAFKMA